MKKLILINGTMGVGKTTTCEYLYKHINNSCWLDGDWCWIMNPFIVTEESKTMVLNNIAYLLNSFLNNSMYETIIFNWVMHQDTIIEEILARLNAQCAYEVYKLTLTCSEEKLKQRIQKDIDEGKRDQSSIARSIERLRLYNQMDTIKIDVGDKGVIETVKKIKEVVGLQD